MSAVQIQKPALTICQPYAWLIIKGIKPVENRTWATTYRGPLFIHAALRLHDHPIDAIERKHRIKIDRDALKFGGIIGVVELIDVVTAHSSPWFEGPFGWVLSRPRRLAFRRLRGNTGLFDAALLGG